MKHPAPKPRDSVRWARRLSELLFVTLCLLAVMTLLSFILTL
ncbi:MAG: hypothetical protein HLUCCA12_12045 [Rhodobacteraceae bacterium HLUCCA12]|nr:MAG: hypothetical protein HLUCCA12_12045 [Rhodobacteraceae bacterium HLUCCA12]